MLDASAILAILHGERGAGAVETRLAGAVVSAVNLSEVVAKLVDGGSSESDIRGRVAELGVTIVPFDDGQAFEAGLLRKRTRARGLSFADRACLALAKTRGIPALTGDRAWATLDIGVTVELFR